MSDLEEMFMELRSCCLHDPQWLPEEVDREITWVGDRKTGRESESIVIVMLKSREYGLLTQCEDYTGHGCQCGSMTVREPTLSKLISHLADYEVERVLQA